MGLGRVFTAKERYCSAFSLCSCLISFGHQAPPYGHSVLPTSTLLSIWGETTFNNINYNRFLLRATKYTEGISTFMKIAKTRLNCVCLNCRARITPCSQQQLRKGSPSLVRIADTCLGRDWTKRRSSLCRGASVLQRWLISVELFAEEPGGLACPT
jgi:hypothetical protein